MNSFYPDKNIQCRTTKNEYQIRHLMADKAYNDRARLLPLPDAEEMTTIRDYLQFPLVNFTYTTPFHKTHRSITIYHNKKK